MKISQKNDTKKLLEENQALRAQIRDFEKLCGVLQAVCSTLQVDEILHHIIEEAISLCQAHQGSIMLFDPDSKNLAKTLIRKGSAKGNILDRYLNNLLAGWVLDQDDYLMTSNLIETFGANLIKQKYHTISSVLSTLLTLHGKIMGVINLITLKHEKQFGKREAWLMEILASQCAHFIVNAKLHEALFAETNRLRKELQDKYSFYGMLGHSPKMREIFTLLERIIPTEARVIIEGESGTGKELIACILHYNGPRKNGPFVAVDCGALPTNLMESELFGYNKGAFTGAIQDKKGLFEEANHGTLFLDEITNMPLDIQSKFLRAIQEGEIRPVGGTKVKKVDVRLIASASRDLQAEVEKGNFREDLFYRLNVVNIKLPPLREKIEDISILAQHFLNQLSEKYDKHIKGFKPKTIKTLEAYVWPGNVRELENVIERMVILAEQDLETIPPELLPSELLTIYASLKRSLSGRGGTGKDSSDSKSQSIKTKKASYEKNILFEALVKHQWNQSSAAKELGIHESTLRYKMQKFGINKPYNA